MNNYTIITFLKENRGQELSLEDVEKGTGLKISSSPQLLQNLKENPSINHREDVSSGTTSWGHSAAVCHHLVMENGSPQMMAQIKSLV
jgi:hypothetical protein